MSNCKQQAVFRYTWPGKDENFICIEHGLKLQRIAQAMGLYIQLIPLSEDERLKANCSQEIKDSPFK
jgi:hypothetical protein